MRFSRQEKKWPQHGQRRSEWVSVEESAARRVEEPGLKDILSDLTLSRLAFAKAKPPYIGVFLPNPR